MPYAEVNGVRLYYEIYGEGEPVVFIHGIGVTSSVWEFQKEAVARHFRMIVYDLRGSGYSGKTPWLFHTADMMSEDLCGLIDYLGYGRVHVVGLSLGAAIAMKFAADYPRRVRSLVVTGAFADLNGILGFISRYFSYFIGKLLMYRLFGELATKIMLPSASRKELLYYHKNIIKIDPEEVRKYRQILGSYSITPALERIAAPMLILYGAYEPVFHKYGCMIKKKAANASVRIIPGVGHGWNGEAPEVFNGIIIDFIRKANT